MDLDKFMERAECITLVGEMIDDISGLVSKPIRVAVLNNSQRLARDKKNKDTLAIGNFRDLITGSRKDIRRGMRVKGTKRPVGREYTRLFDPGRYVIEVNDGSKHRPRTKNYELTVPSSQNYHAYLQRIS